MDAEELLRQGRMQPLRPLSGTPREELCVFKTPDEHFPSATSLLSPVSFFHLVKQGWVQCVSCSHSTTAEKQRPSAGAGSTGGSPWTAELLPYTGTDFHTRSSLEGSLGIMQSGEIMDPAILCTVGFCLSNILEMTQPQVRSCWGKR